jgi:hypothetical protein
VHADGDEDDGGEGEEEDGVDEDGERAGMEVAELDDPALAGQLEEQARRQQDEQHQRDEHRPPILHLRLPRLFSVRRRCWCVSLALNQSVSSLGSGRMNISLARLIWRGMYVCRCRAESLGLVVGRSSSPLCSVRAGPTYRPRERLKQSRHAQGLRELNSSIIFNRPGRQTMSRTSMSFQLNYCHLISDKLLRAWLHIFTYDP